MLPLQDTVVFRLNSKLTWEKTMGKVCWFCKNTEDYFIAQKEELLKTLDKELNECENFEFSIIEITKEKLGFTEDAKKKVKSIQTVYSEMTLNAVLENKDNFIKLEPNLNIILDYCHTYRKQNLKTVREVIESYLTEPIEARYSNELRQNEAKKNQLLKNKEKLENIKTFFIEKEITPRRLDTELQKLRRVPEDYNQSYSFTRMNQRAKPDEKDFNFSYEKLGFNFSKKIYICPICLSIFAESANASFDIVEAQKKAQHDAEMDDWDDDDDDF